MGGCASFMQTVCKKTEGEPSRENSGTEILASPAVVPLEAPAKLCSSTRRRPWSRRVHAVLGIISALNLFVLITTGFLLQHSTLLKLDERSLTRKILPSGYRPQDVGDARLAGDAGDGRGDVPLQAAGQRESAGSRHVRGMSGRKQLME